MLDAKEAQEILGLGRNASRNDIERRYSILLKKHRMSSSQDENSNAEQDKFELITKAYNLLMGYEEPQIEQNPKKPNPLMKKMGIDEKKAQNFFYYYKFHMIIGIILLITVIFTVKGCVNRIEPDFSTAFIGEIIYSDSDAFKKEIKAAVPEIKEPGFDGAFLTPDGKGEQEYAMQMKAMVLFAAQDVDLFILDKNNFKKYAQEGAFVSLDEIASNLGVDKEKNKEFVLKTKDESNEHLYGIDISSSKALKDGGITGKEFIAALPVRGKQLDKTLKVLKLLLK